MKLTTDPVECEGCETLSLRGTYEPENHMVTWYCSNCYFEFYDNNLDIDKEDLTKMVEELRYIAEATNCSSWITKAANYIDNVIHKNVCRICKDNPVRRPTSNYCNECADWINKQ